MRLFVAFISVMIGIGAAATEAWFAPTTYVLTGSAQESRLLFDYCVTFYAGVYLAGRLLYALLRRYKHAEQLRRWSAWHMLVLHGFGFAYVLSLAVSGTASVARPATLIAGAMFVVTMIECWCSFRRDTRVSD